MRGVRECLRELQCNHAGTEVTGTVGSSMIAACALALVSNDYRTRSRMWAAS